MQRLLFWAVVALGSSVFAGWSEDFREIKEVPRSYEDSGAICEELARLKFQKRYPNSNYEVAVGIAYGDTQRTIGELDIVVFDRYKAAAVQVAEVKCWKDMGAGLRKARDQRSRFLNNMHSNKQIYFQSTSSSQQYELALFKRINNFTTLGQKGSLQAGYDDELEYSLEELRRMSAEMIRCQHRGECARPH